MIDLTELLVSFSELETLSDKVVARQNGAFQTRQDFLRRVGQFQDFFSSQSAKRWGLYLEDSFDFAACFLACLQLGNEPIILPNGQPEFLEQIFLEVDAILTDQDRPEAGYFHLGLLSEFESVPEFRCLDSHSQLALFTSGSTGKPKKIVKTVAHLSHELSTLERVWGTRVADSVSLTTVSHQHIYGLLFQVLWPLCSARVFETQVFSYPSDLVERMRHLEKVVLISSPAHLNRFTKLADLTPHSSRLAALFCSGGALERPAALSLLETLGQSVVEVYGSTETGGVAHREQRLDPDSKLWTPFSVVDIVSEPDTSKLSLRSPYLECASRYVTEDRICLQSDGRFELLGRADRVVKIEGKRVSLDEFELRLKASGYIEEARALLLTEGRTSVGVVLVPSKRGRELIGKGSTAEFKAVLKEKLGAYFERVLLPRKWRVVEELPTNSQGKCTMEKLKMVFAQGKIEKPLVVSVNQSEDSVELTLSIREDLRYFDGHFPGHPVLPGIAQVDWAIEFAQHYFSIEGEFQGLEALKFPAFIEPKALICLKLVHRPDKQKVSFTFTKDERKVSSGRIVFD